MLERFFSYSVAFSGLMTYIILFKRMKVLNFNIVEMMNFPLWFVLLYLGFRIFLYLEVIKIVFCVSIWKPSLLRSNWFRPTKGFNVCACVYVRNRQAWLDEMLFGEWRSGSTWQVRRQLLQSGRDMMVALHSEDGTVREKWVDLVDIEEVNECD